VATETDGVGGEDLGARRRRPLATRGKGQRPRQPRETIDLVAAAARIVRSIGQRAAAEDPEILPELVKLRGEVDRCIYAAVAGQRAAGITWEAIGTATGTTRQAALMKWGPKI
jgi:hypothetical protein